MEDRDKKFKEIKKEVKKQLDVNLVEKLLGNNEIEFEYKKEKYKVRKPTYKERQDSYQRKIVKYNELLQLKDENGNYKYKIQDDLTAIYKERGIDIEEMDNKFLVLETKINNYKEKLGKALKEKKSDNELKIFRDEITNLLEQQKKISVKKNSLLESSLENQVLIYLYNYLTFLVTEKLKKDKWVKVWNSFEDFLNEEEQLINTASFYASLVIVPNNAEL
jgi:hypothetical protein